MPELSLDQITATATRLSGQTPAVQESTVGVGSGIDVKLAPMPEAKTPLPKDRTALDTVAHGVDLVESGGMHFAKSGEVLTSPTGNRGRMQLGPSSFPGVNIDDEKTNLETGKRYLGELYDKYGNWDNALVAYNWGPQRTDKWLAAGADPSKLPDETKRYVPQVLARAGLSDTGANSVIASKRTLSAADIAETAKTLAGGDVPQGGQQTLDEALTTALQHGDISGGVPAEQDELFGRQSEALLQGARKGVTDLILGPIQFGLEQVAPDAAAAMTARVNELEEKYGGAENAREHSVFSFAGQVAGITGAMLASRGALGAVNTPVAMARTLPTVMRTLKAATAGAALGGTAYNPDPANTSRLLEAALGTTFGVLGSSIGGAVSWASRKLADKGEFTRALTEFQDATAEVGRNVAAPVQRFLGRVGSLWEQNNRLYGQRNTVGRGFEGFDTDSLRDVLKVPMTESRWNGVAVAPGTKQHTARVYEELGLKEDDARRAAAEQAQADYEKEYAAWFKTVPKFSRDPAMQDAIVANRVSAGSLSPPPQAPAAYVSEPVPAAKFSAAVTAVNRGIRAARNDPAAKHQLTQLGRELNAAASDQAAEMGMTVEQFLRRSAAANKFYEENIVPVMKLFKTASVRELSDPLSPRGLTPARFFDAMTGVIESGDTVKIAAFKKAVGPGSEADMKAAALYQMLNKGQPADGVFSGTRAAAYVRENEEALRELFGRDKTVEMMGWARIAERVSANPEKQRKWLSGTKSWLPFVGAEEIFQGAFRGSPQRMLAGGVLIAAPYASHALFTLMSKMERVPGILPLVKAAGRLRPESPELEVRLNAIERIYRRSLQIAGRAGAETYAGPSQPQFTPVPALPPQ